MTYEEYQKLYEEWESTDSIKRNGEIEGQKQIDKKDEVTANG